MNAEAEAEAKLRYRMTQFDVLKPGAYVTCAVSGARIPLDAVRYWSVKRQEAYAGPDEAAQAYEAVMENAGR